MSELTVAEAARICEKRFGRFQNLWYDRHRRLYFVGKFLTDRDEYDRDERGRVRLDERGRPCLNLPHRRRQVIFGQGATVEEAMRFLTGKVLVGYTPSFSRAGAVTMLKSPGGLVVTRIPAPTPEVA